MPFVVIQVLMVAIVIAFPGIVTGNVSEAAGAIKGSGADELRRQLEAPARPARRARETPARARAPKGDEAGSELERHAEAAEAACATRSDPASRLTSLAERVVVDEALVA